MHIYSKPDMPCMPAANCMVFMHKQRPNKNKLQVQFCYKLHMPKLFRNTVMHIHHIKCHITSPATIPGQLCKLLREKISDRLLVRCHMC